MQNTNDLELLQPIIYIILVVPLNFEYFSFGTWSSIAATIVAIGVGLTTNVATFGVLKVVRVLYPSSSGRLP